MDGRKRTRKKLASPVVHPCGPDRVSPASAPMLRLAGLRWLACWRTPMEEVRVLDYAHASLYDVPGEIFLYERTLEELILDSNRIKDLPRPLFHCHGLKILRLSDNDLVALPEAICDLVQLQFLDVSRNALNAFPDTVNACKRLTVINASCNPLLRLPEGITQLISLQELYLNDTDLEFLPANVGRLSKLRVLEVRDNRLASLPTAMARLKQLQRLDIGHNEFQAWPEVISRLVSLSELLCDLNELTTVPPWIGNLQDLTCLDASNNRIQVVAPELGSCFKLVDLRLSFNELQCLPHTLGHLKNLITLKVDHNYLERLPDSIGSCELLEEVAVCHNNIQVLTPQIGILRKLRILDVDDNRLEEIPPEVGSCKNLRVLSVRQNELTSIPPELGHLPVIRVLNLADNHLQNLPVSILNLMSLQALWLSDIQSSPLVQLHQEFDAYLGRRVLTGILLPQQPTHNLSPHDEETEWGEAVLIRRSGRIRFSQDLSPSDDEPGVLLRAPTPYPKELRMLAKQARNMVAARTQVATLFVQDAVGPSLNNSSINIKEAKVKKPQEGVFLLPEHNSHHDNKYEQSASTQCDVSQALMGQMANIYDMSPESRELEAIEANRLRNGDLESLYAANTNGQCYDLYARNEFDMLNQNRSPDMPSIQHLSLNPPDGAAHTVREDPYGTASASASASASAAVGSERQYQRRPITREESFTFCREEEASQYSKPEESPYGDASSQIVGPVSLGNGCGPGPGTPIDRQGVGQCVGCTGPNRVMEVRAQRVVFERNDPSPGDYHRVAVRRRGSLNATSRSVQYHDARLTYQNIATCYRPTESIYNNNLESVYGTWNPRGRPPGDSSIYSHQSPSAPVPTMPTMMSMTPEGRGNYGTTQRQPIYATRRKDLERNGDQSLSPARGSSEEQIVML